MKNKLRKKIIVGEIFFTFYTHQKKKHYLFICVYIYIVEEVANWREKERGQEEEERRAEEEAEVGQRVGATVEVDQWWHELGLSLSLLPSAWCVLVRIVEIDLR